MASQEGPSIVQYFNWKVFEFPLFQEVIEAQVLCELVTFYANFVQSESNYYGQLLFILQKYVKI